MAVSRLPPRPTSIGTAGRHEIGIGGRHRSGTGGRHHRNPHQKRIKLSLITAVSNRGELRWMIVDGAVNAPTFIRFLERLIREARCKVFLILDRLRVHRARLTRNWLAAHSPGIEELPHPPHPPECSSGNTARDLKLL